MHGLDYIHGDLKSVRVSFDLIHLAVEAFYSAMFLLMETTLPASRILDRHPSFFHRSPMK